LRTVAPLLPSAHQGMTRARTLLLIVGGTISVAVGIVGIFVPLLPTTPFLLLAAFLYARGSKRLYKRLLGNRLIGNYLRRYYERRCMTCRHKLVTLTLLWTVIVLSAALAADSWWARGILGGVAVAVTTHILLLPGERDRSEARDS